MRRGQRPERSHDRQLYRSVPNRERRHLASRLALIDQRLSWQALQGTWRLQTWAAPLHTPSRPSPPRSLLGPDRRISLCAVYIGKPRVLDYDCMDDSINGQKPLIEDAVEVAAAVVPGAGRCAAVFRVCLPFI